jgi:hypothetical protein
MAEKKCPKCQLVKAMSEFNKDSSKANGHESRCRKCKYDDDKAIKDKKRQQTHNQVENKTCTKCCDVLPASMFNKDAYSKDGLKSMCKSCYSSIRKQSIMKSKQYDYATLVKEKHCKKCDLVKPISEFSTNRKSVDNYSYICKDCTPKSQWTKEQQAASHKKHCEKESVAIYRKLRLSQNNRIAYALKTHGLVKGKRTIEYLGCSLDFLREWFEYQFKGTNMSWMNHGTWEIDHVTPCASFDLTKEEQAHTCFHWSNLRPLWATENIRKRDKIIKSVIDTHAKIVGEFLIAKNKEGELTGTP